jgi:hypothetical protein
MAFFITTTVILLAAAAFFNAVMDKLQHHYGESIFPQDWQEKFLWGSRQYWDPKESWKNKWKDGDKAKGPKFPFSHSAFVFLTDGRQQLRS